MTTSSDGALTVTADPTTCSILITTQFPALASPPPAPTINLLINPNNETAVGFLNNANATVVQSSTVAQSGTFSARATSVGTATTSVITPTGLNGVQVAPSTAYTASAYVRAAATSRTVALTIYWYSAAGSLVTTSTAGTGAADSTSAWTRVTVTGTSPATAVYAAVYVSWTGTVASEIHYIDSAQVEAGSTATAYCDGRQSGGLWTGAVDASVSYRPAYNTLTVTRADGTIVRGLNAAMAPSGITTKGIDHEAPRGVAVVYTARLSNGTGFDYVSTTATATIAADTTTWIKSLRFPALSLSVDVNTPPDWAQGMPLAALYPLMGQYPLVQAGVRRARTAGMAINTVDRAGQNAVETLLASVGPYLIQFAPNSGEPDRYVTIGDSLAHVDVPVAATQDRTISFGLTEVQRPSTAGSTVTYPGHDYAHSTATWVLYSNRTGAYGTR